jgi:hypothetical protein
MKCSAGFFFCCLSIRCVEIGLFLGPHARQGRLQRSGDRPFGRTRRGLCNSEGDAHGDQDAQQV